MKYSEIIKKINNFYIHIASRENNVECPFGKLTKNKNRIKFIEVPLECGELVEHNFGCEFWVKDVYDDNGTRIYCKLQKEKIKKELLKKFREKNNLTFS